PHASSLVFLSGSPDHRDLHSFPTRRSSDLSVRTLPDRAGRCHRSARTAVADTTPSCAGSAAPCDPWRGAARAAAASAPIHAGTRSEEHTSELQSRENLVCRLLLEKKKKNEN